MPLFSHSRSFPETHKSSAVDLQDSDILFQYPPLNPPFFFTEELDVWLLETSAERGLFVKSSPRMWTNLVNDCNQRFDTTLTLSQIRTRVYGELYHAMLVVLGETDPRPYPFTEIPHAPSGSDVIISGDTIDGISAAALDAAALAYGATVSDISSSSHAPTAAGNAPQAPPNNINHSYRALYRPLNASLHQRLAGARGPVAHSAMMTPHNRTNNTHARNNRPASTQSESMTNPASLHSPTVTRIRGNVPSRTNPTHIPTTTHGHTTATRPSDSSSSDMSTDSDDSPRQQASAPAPSASLALRYPVHASIPAVSQRQRQQQQQSSYSFSVHHDSEHARRRDPWYNGTVLAVPTLPVEEASPSSDSDKATVMLKRGSSGPRGADRWLLMHRNRNEGASMPQMRVVQNLQRPEEALVR